MKTWRKLAAAVLSGIICMSAFGVSAFAETEESTEAPTEAETAALTTSEEKTSGAFTYHINDEYGGAVITAYTPEESDVEFPEKIDGHTVVGLGDFLFNQQTQVETVTIPDNICHIGASAFYGTSITEFIVSDSHPMYKTEDGVLFSKDGIALVAYPPKKEDTSYVVPDTVEELYHGCFASNTYITELTLPEGLLYVDSWAFAYTTIQELTIPEGVEGIEPYACAYMTRLESFETPESLVYIGSAAFAGCANLTDITLNEGLVEIGQSAFAGTGIRNIVIPTTVTELGYCSLGYDTNLKTSYSTLVIYGLSGSVAQTYATDKDEEYDYENNFTFVPKTADEIKGMLGAADDNDGSSEEASEPAVIVEEEKETDTKGILKVVFIAAGALVLIGGGTAIFMSSKKSDSKKKD